MKPKYGKSYSVTERYLRVYTTKEVTTYGSQFSRDYKVWVKKPYAGLRCIFLGTRCLKNGFIEYDQEEGFRFSPREHFMAALLSPGENLNPIYAPLDCLKIAEDSGL